MARQSDESAFLSAGVEKLRPLLEEQGFQYDPGHTGVSSSGPFATGHFRRGDVEIGLIVRHRNELGSPNYSEGRGYAGHEGLFWALGRDGEARLVPGEYDSYIAGDGGNPFDALETDLRGVILPALRTSEVDFRSAIARAYRRFQDRLRGSSD